MAYGSVAPEPQYGQITGRSHRSCACGDGDSDIGSLLRAFKRPRDADPGPRLLSLVDAVFYSSGVYSMMEFEL